MTRVAARLDGQAIAPAPPLGFSGAAAVDAQGRFAGMVELKSAFHAAAGTATNWQTTLIPVNAVRAFLTAHRVTPESSGGAIEKSVVRVVCVRK